jgi:transcriptional antiterminator NusG
MVSYKQYAIKAGIGREALAIMEIEGRLSNTGSMQSIREEIGKISWNPDRMSGYFYIEATNEHFVKKVCGLLKERHIPRLKHLSRVIGESSQESVDKAMKPKNPLEGVEVGSLVQILSGSFKGERARVISINEGKQTVSIELFDQPIPMPIHNFSPNDMTTPNDSKYSSYQEWLDDITEEE